MARPKNVNTYSHRKNKHIKVHVYHREDGTAVVYYEDQEKGRVKKMEDPPQ